jgi:Domain of unknown function (DUF4177)
MTQTQWRMPISRLAAPCIHPGRVISASVSGDMVDVRDTVEDTLRRFEYRVIELRENRIGGALSGDKLEEILNDEAQEGWMLKSITHADVKGRLGPGGVEGLILTFERPLA